MQIIPLPLDSYPRYTAKIGSFSDEDLAKFKRAIGRGEWITCNRYFPHTAVTIVGCTDEPLDRLAGMISDYDFDAMGFAMQFCAVP